MSCTWPAQLPSPLGSKVKWLAVGGTSSLHTHRRLRARDHCTSSTLIGGTTRSRSKFTTSHYAWGRDRWSKRMQYGCKVYLHGFLRGVKWIMFRGHLDRSQKSPLATPTLLIIQLYGSPNMIVGCSKSCARKFVLKLSFHCLIVLLWGHTLLSDVMQWTMALRVMKIVLIDLTPGDYGTPKSHNCWFIVFYHVWGPHMNRNSLK